MQFVSRYQSPLGEILLAAEEEKLIGLWFSDQKHFAVSLEENREEAETPVLALAKRWLAAYFAGEDPAISVPLRPHGTPFQQEVWSILSAIPYGRTVTYGEIAQKLANRRGLDHFSAQAVGGAVGRNPISILLPCHRVVGSSGSLTGYAGGIDRKRALLRLEGVDLSRFFLPKRGTAL